MRTGLLAGLITTGTVLLLGFGQALSNADFIYMCAGAALLDGGHLPVTPYFPPGYPALLWLVVKLGLLVWPGMTALHAGTVLSAIGAGLSAGALTFGARLYRVPPAPALLLGLLGASLPDVAEIAFNPHLDALFTGLALTLLVATLRLHSGKAGAATALTAGLCTILLLTLRWHAVLVVGPCLLLLLVAPSMVNAAKLPPTRQPAPRGISTRRAGVAVLAAAMLGAAGSYGSLYTVSGSLQSAAPLQVATGAVYRQFGPGHETEAVATIFSDYAGWMQTAPPVTSAILLDALGANWPQFLLRKAVLSGVGLCLLLALILRRWPPQAHWLLLFIPGYSAAVATTYFTPRASALLELCALVLAASALSLVFTQEEHDLRKQQLVKRRLHFKPNEPGLRINAAAFGSVLALGLLAGIGYDAWRVQHDFRGPWRTRRVERNAVYSQALALAGADGGAVYGRFDMLPDTQHMPWCLPGPSYSRLWMDDPRVGKVVGDLLPEVAPEEVLEAGQPSEVRGPRSAEHESGITDDADRGPRTADSLRVILLWPSPDNPRDVELAQQFDAASEVWHPVAITNNNARIGERVSNS